MEKKINDIKPYHKNPRKITEKMFNLLGETMREYGDLSGVVVNVRTGEAVGGNQRTAFFKQNPDECEIEITTRLSHPTAQGTVAVGNIKFAGEQFSYREVDWDEGKTERANIIANKVGGFWDNDILANQFDIENLELAGFEDFELGFANDEVQVDTNDLSDTMDAYLDGTIKQIVIYFTKEEFDIVIPRLEKCMQDFGVTSHTEAILKLLDEHEGN